MRFRFRFMGCVMCRLGLMVWERLFLLISRLVRRFLMWGRRRRVVLILCVRVGLSGRVRDRVGCLRLISRLVIRCLLN